MPIYNVASSQVVAALDWGFGCSSNNGGFCFQQATIPMVVSRASELAVSVEVEAIRAGWDGNKSGGFTRNWNGQSRIAQKKSL